jgi:hypothetical protein
VSRMGRREVYRIFVGKSEGKIPLARPKYRQEGNINMDLKRNMVQWRNPTVR